jgi:hypothetical protein
MQAACQLYGAEAVVAARLMDVEGVLPEEARTRIADSLEAFECRFPQLFLLMYLGPQPAPVSPRQFAFWLLNHAAVPDMDAMRPKERGLLLVVDPQGGTAVLASGYYLENFVRQEELDAVLRGAAKDLGRHDFAGALESVAAGLAELLKKRAKEVARYPKRFLPSPDAPGPSTFPNLVRTGETVPMPLPEPEPLLEAAVSAPPEAIPQKTPKPTASVKATVKGSPVQRVKSAEKRLKSKRR